MWTPTLVPCGTIFFQKLRTLTNTTNMMWNHEIEKEWDTTGENVQEPCDQCHNGEVTPTDMYFGNVQSFLWF